MTGYMSFNMRKKAGNLTAQRRLVSLRRKLTTLVMTSLAVALVVTSVITMWHEINRFLQTKHDTLMATASAFGATASAATARRDSYNVAEALRGIAFIPDLLFVEISTVDGMRIASLGAAVQGDSDLIINDVSPDRPLLSILAAETIAVRTPVVHGGERVGYLKLISRSDLSDQLGAAISVVILSSVAALVPSLLLASRIQKSITRPLIQLAGAMDRVSESGVYRTVDIEAPDTETDRLAASFNAMISQIRQATDKILARESEIIDRLSFAGELRDDQTGQHVVRVAKISRIVAENLGLKQDFVSDLYRASPMHDVGKISIPDHILHKPGRLDPEERVEMEKHAIRGYRILSGSDSSLVQLAAEIALSHHEKWDGSGYPYGLAGDNIPISGRITAIADVCDALASERPYKTPWPINKVKQHIIDASGIHFDPKCVDALIASWQEVELVYDHINDRASRLQVF